VTAAFAAFTFNFKETFEVKKTFLKK
jgi:hypothetical protein